MFSPNCILYISDLRKSLKKSRSQYFAILYTTLMVSCIPSQPAENETESPSASGLSGTQAVFGYYVSKDYDKKADGYDWVSVRLAPYPENIEELWVSVRSRADKKKPTCTFDAIAVALNDSTYQTLIRNQEVWFTVVGNQLLISTNEESGEEMLSYYCSGGGSLSGTYQKIEADIDRTQIDTTAFFKHLQLQEIGLSISGRLIPNMSIVTLSPSGLEIVNDTTTMPFPGAFFNAETADLNRDGYPEFLIYMKEGENEEGNVIAYSVNNGKSMSQVYFPPLANNPSINRGYSGHDQFVVTENALSQRFPIAGTDSIREVNYEMLDGEASRYFQVKSTQTFPAPPPFSDDAFKSSQH
jgi:hypothetical protein